MIPPRAMPATLEDLVNNAAVQKSLANEREAIDAADAADAEYLAKVKLLAAARQKKLDQARLTCIEELRRAAAISSQHKKFDETLAIGAKVDELTSELGDTRAPKGNGGWTVLFRSADPSLWNTNMNKGPDSFAIAFAGAPQGIRYLKLARPTGDYVIVPMDNAHLGLSATTGRLGWDGAGYYGGNGFHLGVFGRDISRPQGCVDVSAHNLGVAGWGFGNHNRMDDTQGYGWEGVEIGRTVFQISVKTSPLSDEEMRSVTMMAGVDHP